MKFLKLIDRIVRKTEKFIIGSSVISMAVILVGNVISRKLFGRSWEFAEELSQIFMIAVTFIGTSYAARKGTHIRMSAVFDVVPKKIKKIFMIIISLITSASMAFVFQVSIRYLMDVHKSGRVTPVLKIPVTLVIVLVCLGLLLTAIHYLIIWILNIKNPDIYIGIEDGEPKGGLK